MGYAMVPGGVAVGMLSALYYYYNVLYGPIQNGTDLATSIQIDDRKLTLHVSAAEVEGEKLDPIAKFFEVEPAVAVCIDTLEQPKDFVEVENVHLWGV